jgi:hypothetical protein
MANKVQGIQSGVVELNDGEEHGAIRAQCGTVVPKEHGAPMCGFGN